MRELRTFQWCDVCAMEDDGRTEATNTYTIGLVQGENKPALKVLELCDRHDKIAAEMAHILASIGQLPALPTTKPAAPAAPERPQWECPLCSATIGRNVAVAHVWNRHRRDQRPPMPKRCPDCGAAKPNGQAMTQHRRVEHGHDALADALAGADR